MKAVMYGAGNIGRGFIGQLFSQSGYETALDVYKRQPFTFAHMENVDILITDRRPPDDITELAEQAQVKVIYE